MSAYGDVECMGLQLMYRECEIKYFGLVSCDKRLIVSNYLFFNNGAMLAQSFYP